MKPITRKKVGGSNGFVDIYGICLRCKLVNVKYVGSEKYGMINYDPDAIIDFGEKERQEVPILVCHVCQRKAITQVH